MTFMQRLRGLKRSSRGQSVVEMAMVLPLMLVVAFMIAEFGRALWIKNTLTQAAREGARQAVISTVSESNKPAVAQNVCNEFLTKAGMMSGTEPAPTVTVTAITVGGRDFLQLTVTRDFSFVPSGELSANPFGVGAVVVPTGFTIRAQTIMKYE